MASVDKTIGVGVGGASLAITYDDATMLVTEVRVVNPSNRVMELDILDPQTDAVRASFTCQPGGSLTRAIAVNRPAARLTAFVRPDGQSEVVFGFPYRFGPP